MSTSILNPFNHNNGSNNNMDLDNEGGGGEDDYNDNDFDNVLGIGTSSKSTKTTHLNGIGGIRPLTIADLISTKPIKFVVGVLQNREEEIPYKAINARPQPISITTPVDVTSRPSSSPVNLTSIITTSKSSLPLTPTKTTSSSTTSSSRPKGFFPLIDSTVTWPQQLSIGRGLNNLGNTCFLNSALQVLLHTAPLVRFILGHGHDKESCQWLKKKGFCMTCAMKLLVRASYGNTNASSSSYSPSYVTNNIKKIASHLRLGRQEDAHEFLRFCIDNMQLGCLVDKPPKTEQAIKDSSFVHQVFGGRLRSRVTCKTCLHPSDTFDSMLDLSLDVSKVSSVKEALNTFIKIDELKGTNKYKCEKCKRLVNAEKSFTIEEAPMVLSVHLKRFTAAGRKISDAITYQETLDLSPFMSDKNQKHLYRLYGIINHSGSGPHSGHYTAHVKSAKGQWHHMNDSFISPEGRAPLNSRNAYILFYCREQGNKLDLAIQGGTSAAAAVAGNGSGVNGKMNGNGKRSRESLDGSVGIERMNGNTNGGGGPAQKRPFIGPTHPGSNNSPRPPTVLTANSHMKSSSYQNPYSTTTTSSTTSVIAAANTSLNGNHKTSTTTNGFQSNAGQQTKIYNNLKKKNVPRTLMT